MKIVVRPGLWLASAVAIAILLTLGTWQVKRLQWKTELIGTVEARVDAAPVPLTDILGRDDAEIAYQPVRAVGGFPNAKTAHVPGTYEGVPGAYAFQAMRLDAPDGAVLVINRGFVPNDSRAEFYPLPDAEAMEGLARPYRQTGGLAGAFAPPDRPEDGVFHARDPQRLAAYLAPGEAGEVLPFILDSTLPTELPRGGTTRVTFTNNHLGYAITWYGLAVGLSFVTLIMSRKR